MKPYLLLVIISSIFSSCDFNSISEGIKRGKEVEFIKDYQPSDSIKRFHLSNKDKDCKDCHK